MRTIKLAAQTAQSAVPPVQAAGTIDVAVAREQAAILAYVQQHWDVKGSVEALRALVSAALAVGIQRGEGLAVSDAQSALRLHAIEVQAVSTTTGRRFEPATTTRPPLLQRSFETDINALLKSHRAGLTGAPKGYRAYREGKALSTFGQFTGTRLPSDLSASAPDFAEYISPELVDYHAERDRSPMNTLVSAIVRQGMGLGLVRVRDEIERAIANREAEILAALGKQRGTGQSLIAAAMPG